MLYSPDWANTGFSFIFLTVNLFRHSTLTELGLYWQCKQNQQLTENLPLLTVDIKNVSEYDQEISQSHFAVQPMAP